MSGAEARRSAVDPVARAVKAFLGRHPPFDAMEAPALGYLVSRLTLRYFPKGAPILAPEHGEPAWFYIVQGGAVSLAPAATYHAPGDGILGPGECFSIAALLEHRPVATPYLAAADTFCYQLPAEDFHALLDQSPRFREFSTRYLSSLLRDSRRLLKMHHASLAGEEQAMGRSLRSLIARPAVTCPPDTAIGDALRTMQLSGIGSIIVATPEGAPAGIFTRRDVLDRVALPQRSLGEAIRAVMSAPPRTLPADATAYEAALLIAQHGIRHVPVVDGGKLIGVVTERDLFALQRVSIRSIHRAIADADTPDALRQAALDIRGLARSLIAEGAAAEPLTLIISTLNDAITRRVIDLEIGRGRHRVEGIAWAWLGFGSEGRYEQTISTDQDNGLVFLIPAGETAEGMRARFVPFARAVNATLDACGYPLCKGNIMAGNPQWCLSLEEWVRHFDGWISNTDPGALLGASIFFDLRLLYGREEAVDVLRERMLARSAATPRFVMQLAQQALSVRPPLGMLRDFVTEEDADGRATLDLKQYGARLFTDAARVIALAKGIAHTSTAERLRQGGARLGMSRQEVSSLVEAFFFIQMLRLRRQAADPGGGNRIDPGELNEVDRRMLKESLRQARALHNRLALDYQL